MTEKELLKEQYIKLDNVRTISDYDNWKVETLSVFSAIYGDKSTEYKRLCDTAIMLCYAKESDTPEYVKTAQNLLNGCIKSIELHCSKSSKNHSSNKNNVIINNNPKFTQTQTQCQTQTMDIKDIIKDELPPAKMREIEEILKTEEPEKTKLEKVGDVLQKVGIGVTSSVLARIVTNSMGKFL